MRFLAVAVAWLAGPAAAGAQEQVAYPASLEREPLMLWLQRETDIMADRVVAVTPQALTSVVSTFPAGGGQGPRVVIRSEALSPESQARTGALSWHVSMSADCQARRVRLGETTGYQERNLLGERKVLRAAETDWRTPEAGTALDAAWRSACQSDFKGPLQQSTVKLLRPESAALPVAAAPAAPAPAAPKPVAQPAAPKPGTAAQRAGGMVVQVGASTSEAEARALLAGLADSLGGRDAWIETAQVAGKVWRRAVVGGFADGPQAARFCATLKAAGRGCFVRAGRPG